MSDCTCPSIDGYRIRRTGCPHHKFGSPPITPDPTPQRDPDADDLACAWADYRKDFGVSSDHMAAAHKAFKAGWKAAREGDQSEALR